jgi:GrpB-like predicted nucleotidyltransferase (UPF0157 family)
VRLDAIVVVPYDADWARSFARAREVVEPVLAPCLVRPVEHMGSTAVPGLAAKPIVDMLAVVGDVDDAHRVLPVLAEVGWVHAPEPGDDDDRMLSVCSPSVERRTHHLHVVEERSQEWRGWLAFRDHLRTHADARDDYAALKSELARRVGGNPDDREPYRQGKAEFIRAQTALAQAEGLGPR